MFRLRYFAATFLWLTLLVPAYGSGNKRQSSAAKLTHDIQDIVDDQDSARGFWGIEAVSLDSGRTLVSLNQDKLFTPASNAKLFTTAAVFGLIGPDYRFKTTVETMGTLDKYGRLDADLIVVGRGDPNLSGRTLPYNMRTERRAPPIQVLQDLADELVVLSTWMATSSPTTPTLCGSATARAGRRTTWRGSGAHRFRR
jgi:D-alanyl-D-alanine carboxypeptidase